MKKVVIIFILILFLISIKIISPIKVTGNPITGEQITGEVSSRETNVSVNVTAPINTAPVLGPINSSIFVCEGNSLSYGINATDNEADDLTLSITPQDPFFVFRTAFTGKTFITSDIISGILQKANAGGTNNGFLEYNETIKISDGSLNDSANTTITVIEINNAPNISTIGVQTIWNKGENSTFYKEVDTTDTEDGNRTDGNLYFNISITNSSGSSINLFNISSIAILNFTANTDTTLGVYDISVCVNDTGIANPFANITQECGENGSTKTVCEDFSLTVTDENRAPNITSYYPLDLNFSESGTVGINFNLTKTDPDGTIPDTYWYVNNVSKERDTGSSNDTFQYTFDCGISGNQTIKAEITDGLLNDSIQWNITLGNVDCPISSEPPTGGDNPPPGSTLKKFSINRNTIGVKLSQGESQAEEVIITNEDTTQLSFVITSLDLEDYLTIVETNFTLQPNEQKKLILIFSADDESIPELYLGKLIVNSHGTKREVPISVEVETKEVIFDVNVEMLEESLPILPGKDIIVNITIRSLGGKKEFDVAIEYSIKNEAGDELLLETEVVSVNGIESFTKKFKIPKNIRPGNYILYIKATHEGQVGSSSIWFFFSEENAPLLKINEIIIIAIISLIILILLIIFIKKRKRFENNNFSTNRQF